MKLKHVLTINAFFAGFFGLCYSLIPYTISEWFGIPIDEQTLIPVRLLGAAFLGIATIRYLIRNEPDSKIRRIIIIESVVQDSLGF